MMSFTARPEHQWQFILRPQHTPRMMNWGTSRQARVEYRWEKIMATRTLSRSSGVPSVHPKFARMLSGVWKHMRVTQCRRMFEALKAKFRREGRRLTRRCT